jgi:molybdopterin/thiamine biosynthesis adenylyltransferase/molybdopterin synthase catalytic subunit/rhodanese-related sulfurtransferase
MKRFRMAAEAVELAVLRQPLEQSGAGGYCSFEGWVRDTNEGRPVDGLDYEAYNELALSEGERIIEEALARYEITDAAAVHRTGSLKIGDLAVWIGVSSAHRDAAFRACRYIIDEIKHRLPIWKKERYLEGDTAWVACMHTERAHLSEAPPAHDHDHAHHHHADAQTSTTEATRTPFVPDYSRQQRLRDIGPAGQAKLAASRVLVIGAGGLGCPVLSYLAGAGVGTLGIVDGDWVDASNLHRQTLYTAMDVGQRKVDAAARRISAVNPTLNVRTYNEPLDASNAEAVFAEYDLIVECTDDLRSRYLTSDAAVLTAKPVVFASIYQYEGQLHIYTGQADAPCLRCLWPTMPDPATVGTCAEAGVLGPVPGVLGAMQAVEALKLLLNLPGARRDSLVLVDLLELSTRHIELPQGASCSHDGCAASARQALAQARATEALELRFERLHDAVAAGYQLVDVREPAEIAAQPLSALSRQLPSGQITEQACSFAPGRYLLVCASGRRSLHAAQTLRAGGVEAYSLAGGVAALAHSALAD